ncbi:hypothetical protein BZG36_00947 [Bifiguratus adelaidae]|uniref:ABC transmembrane type-1 domain-containing protein n=1 Tax=Bifiguratus adelaidae TaxID=1938954 RepID=A0A261Y5E9_9FUNG|nr:hypothetical protein BZG36_00947 [Bifiguratus adelaidae]
MSKIVDPSATISTSPLTHLNHYSDQVADPDFHLYLPSEIGLLRYRFLLWTKLFGGLPCAAIFTTGAGLSSFSNAGGSNIFGCLVCAIGALLGAFSSFRQHQSTWRASVILQCYLVLMLTVLVIRVRTEWLRTDKCNLALAITLSLGLGHILLWLFLESIPRIRSSETQQMNLPPDMTSNIFSVMIFQYAQPLLATGYRLHRQGQDMDTECLYPLRPAHLSRRLGDAFVDNWKKQARKHGQGRISMSLLAMCAQGVIVPFALYYIYVASQFANPMLLNGFLNWLSSFDSPFPQPVQLGIELAFGMCSMTAIVSMLFQGALMSTNQTLMAFRGALLSAIYRKALRLSPEELHSRSVGDISNHISVDAESLFDGDLAFLALIGVPFTMILAVYFLYLQLSWAVFPGLAWYLFIMFGVQGRFGKFYGRTMKYRLKHMDKRVGLVNESVSGIKFVKLNAWETPFTAKIMETREEELNGLKRRARVFAGMSFSTQMNRNYTPMIMFWVYEMVIAKTGDGLDANKIFVSLIIANIVTASLQYLSNSLSWFYTAVASMKRVQTFLNADEVVIEEDDNFTDTETIIHVHSTKNEPKKPMMGFRDAVFTWVKKMEEAKFKLQIPEITIYDRDFIAVVGRVGAGKSSFLSAILTAMYRQEGRIYVDKAPIAYCAQSAFIMNASLQSNITFGQPFDKVILDEVVEACALDVDINMLPAGIETEIGERGIGLSGGQKARVALARACYAVLTGYTSLVMLDDVLSAVDVHTKRHLFQRVLSTDTGILRNTTRILVTHAVHYGDKFDRIMYFANGCVAQIGTHTELMSSEGSYKSLMGEYAHLAHPDQIDSAAQAEQAVPETQETKEASTADKTRGVLTDKEEMEIGRVSWKVYTRFIVAGGIVNFCLMEAVLALHRVVWFVGYYWLSDWLALPSPPHRSAFYLGIYTLFQLLAAITLPIGYYMGQSRFGVRASKFLFVQVLIKVFRAPMSFFDATPAGRILNRLTTDMNQVDVGLTDKLIDTLSQLNQVLASLIAAGVATPYLFVMLPPVTVLYYWIMVYYQASVRSLRRLDAGGPRSPLFQHVSHTIEGVQTLKAYQLTDKWLTEFHKRVDLNQRSKRMEIILNGWMMMRMDFLGATLILGCSIFAITARSSISNSVVGLALSALMTMVQFFFVLVDSISGLEVAAVHAERVLHYTELPSEAPLELACDEVRKTWPEKGTITFKNFSTRYRSELPLTIKNLSVQFEGGSKIAIVGRTGSGKSTLSLALFRMIEDHSLKSAELDSDADSNRSWKGIEEGELATGDVEGAISIDGVNIAELGLAKLRGAIAIIPQDATMFGGTLRTNLSPFDDHTDEELWHVLGAAGLKEHVKENMTGGLDAEIQSGGVNLSKGQLQQVGLARAMLRKAAFWCWTK